jgi:hypothetical protein
MSPLYSLVKNIRTYSVNKQVGGGGGDGSYSKRYIKIL